MFRAAYRSSSGAPNCICSLWFIYPKHVEPSINFGIINSITRLHLVGDNVHPRTGHEGPYKGIDT